jgi:hypothetical protein
MLDPIPPSAQNNDLQVFEQKHGKNWRRFTLSTSGVRAEIHKENGDSSDTAISFSTMGIPAGDYTDYKVDEQSMLSKRSDFAAAACLLGGLWLLSQCFTGNTLQMGLSFYIAIVLFIAAGGFALNIRRGKVKVRSFELGRDELPFYYRHMGEIDEVHSFMDLLAERAGMFWKTRLAAMVKDAPSASDTRPLLEALHQRKIITDEEYNHYDKTITKPSTPKP